MRRYGPGNGAARHDRLSQSSSGKNHRLAGHQINCHCAEGNQGLLNLDVGNKKINHRLKIFVFKHPASKQGLHQMKVVFKKALDFLNQA